MGRSLTPKEKYDLDLERFINNAELLRKQGKTFDEIILIEAGRITTHLQSLKKLAEETQAEHLSDAQFDDFVEALCNRFKEEETIKEFRRVAYAARSTHNDPYMSLMQSLKLTSDAMVRSEKYRKTKK